MAVYLPVMGRFRAPSPIDRLPAVHAPVEGGATNQAMR